MNRKPIQKRITYATLYNTVFLFGENKEALNLWIQISLRNASDNKERYRLVGYIMKLNKQFIGHRISPCTHDAVVRWNRLLDAYNYRQLIHVQRCVLKYLWKPNGPMFSRDLKFLRREFGGIQDT